MSDRGAQRVIRRLGQDAGPDNLTQNVLRHTFAKNLVDRGVGPEKVAALLGFSNPNSVRIYLAPDQDDLEKAVEQLSNRN